MRRLWERMVAIYGHKWTSTHGVIPHDEITGSLTVTGETWQQGLRGITGQQFGRGLEACITRNDEWPPTLPEFRAMCLSVPRLAGVRSEVLALASRDSRSLEATPFARLVWTYIDGYRFRQVSADQSDRMLREAYDLAREHVMRGGELPEVVGQIEHEKCEPKPADPKVAEEALAAIRAELFGKAAAAGPDL